MCHGEPCISCGTNMGTTRDLFCEQSKWWLTSVSGTLCPIKSQNSIVEGKLRNPSRKAMKHNGLSSSIFFFEIIFCVYSVKITYTIQCTLACLDFFWYPPNSFPPYFISFFYINNSTRVQLVLTIWCGTIYWEMDNLPGAISPKKNLYLSLSSH